MRHERTRVSPEEQEAAILKAAAEEVSLVGIGRLSLDVIARQAGVSRSTLYRRFPEPRHAHHRTRPPNVCLGHGQTANRGR